MEARTALTPAISAPGVMPGHKKHKESIFVLPVFSRDTVAGIMTLVIKAPGYGGFMALVPGAVAALLPPADVKPQYIAAALQGGLAAVAAAAVAIPEIQRITEDKFVIIPNAGERWTTQLSTLQANDPLKIAVLVGMRQKYKLAARQAGGLACTVGAGYFIKGPFAHWDIVSGAMAAGLIGVSFFGDLAQKQIWRDAVKSHAAVLDLSIAEPAADVDVNARKAIGEVERLSKETSILPDLGSGISILLAAAGGLVGCLVAARIISGREHEDHNAESEALRKHVKFALPS